MKIGIIGAGQLGQMLGYAAKSLNLECIFLDPNKNSPACDVGEVLHYQFDDLDGIKQLFSLTDIITYEFENVPVKSIKMLDSNYVYPGTMALEIAQDRLQEKKLFELLRIPIAEYKEINSHSDLLHAAFQLGYPFILKTRRFGYDGKGQILLEKKDDIDNAWTGMKDQLLIAEKKVEFDYEISAIGARNISGETAFYPLTKNTHKNGILRTSETSLENQSITKKAFNFHSKLMAKLNYVGVLALELFIKGNKVIANEFAPRVHNSGHWTIEGSKTSQFENHLRAILNLKLGDTSSEEYVAMENLIGSIPSEIRQLNKDFFVHDYGKQERPNRKLGHISVIGKTQTERESKLKIIQKILSNKTAI